MNLNVVKNTLIKHGPSILTGVAMIGVAITGYLVHRAEAKNAVDICVAYMDKTCDEPYHDVCKEVYKRNWKRFIPSAACGLATMGLIFGANHWHLSKEGALAAAALMYKANSEDLEKKLREEFGNDKVDEVKQKIREAKEDAERPPWEEKPKIKMHVWEHVTGQFLDISQQDILWAELNINKWLSNYETVTVNDLVRLLGGRKNRNCNIWGWRLDDETFDWNASFSKCGPWVDLEIVKGDDGTLNLIYSIEPNELKV